MKYSTPYGKVKVYCAESRLLEAERVLVIPGYSETLAHSRKLVDALAASGFNASTFSQPRRAGKETHKVKDPIQRQGNVVLSLVETTVPQREKVHAVAHSLGSAAALRAAQEAPERFASITLMQPLGMVGEQSLPELANRVGKKVVKNQSGALRRQNPSRQPKVGYAASVDTESALRYSGRVAKAQLAGSGVIGKQPTLALKEALAVAKYEIADDITKVTELGIPVNIVTAHSDEMFDHDKVDAGYEASIHTASSFSSVADREARHDTFWLQPERTAAIIGQLIQKS